MTSAVDRRHLHGAAGQTYSGAEAGRLLWHRRDPLPNSQVDSHACRDTVPFDAAARAAGHFIEHGTWPADVTVEDDRGE
ncbi:hypothetical protein [Streptomyces erythrochromogenes]|uniref:hypothetical protein n=1 Tax=Streptomyces erythrochromogenes TaxID=285574 RepID=UPI0036CD0967